MLPRYVIRLAVIAAAITLGLSAAAQSPLQNDRSAQRDPMAGSCLECHDGRHSSGMREHLIEWRRSAHAGESCTACHGGDASATDSVKAHAPHVNGADPLSATNGHNLNRTCGRCHQAIVSRAEQNPHFSAVQVGERFTPTCVTCHGEVAADPPAPARMRAVCDQCHGVGKSAAHPQYGAGMYIFLIDIESGKRVEKAIRSVIEPLPAGPGRDRFMEDLNRITGALALASIQGHGGDNTSLATHLATARQSTADLLVRLGAFFMGGPPPAPAGVVLRPSRYVTGGQATPGCDAAARPANMAFVVKDMNGVDVRFADYKGKVVLLNFWATWCGPCKTEIPWFTQLQEKYRPAGLQVLGFSVDDPPEKLKPYAAQFHINYPLLQGTGHDDVQDAFGPIWGVPMTFLISRDGRLCRKYRGIASKEDLERDIKPLL